MHPSLATLQDVLDLELEGPDRLAVDEHLTTCGECRRSLHALRWTKVRLAGVGHGASLPAALDAEIRRSVGVSTAAEPVVSPEASTPHGPTDPASRQWFAWWRKTTDRS